MKSAAIEAKLLELRANPEAVAWQERVRLVGGLLGECNPARPLDGHTAELARLLAADPKWEVRMELANHLHRFSDTDFAAFTAILAEDDNAFVKSAAERELARRRKGHVGTAKRLRGLSRMDDELRKLERKHGPGAANMVSEMAHKLYEGLVGASVHEMRSVLTGMKLDIEQLAADPTGAPVIAKVAPRLALSATYLERLLDDMKEYTRVPKHDLATESLADLCADALRMVRAELMTAGRDASPVSVTCEVAPDLLVRVSRMAMVLALRNLIKNAHEAFMRDEYRFDAGTIRVTADREEDGIRLVIEDTGLGLTEDELADVRQFIPGRSSKGRLGTGFGLPIARRNIQTNGGDLRIESCLDKGTQITVWLPHNRGKEP